MKRYSQDDTEDVLVEVFGDYVGRFLDIGAFDGISHSNTRMLFEKGWGGVVVEPSIIPLYRLFALYKNVDRVDVVAAYISAKRDRGVIKFSDGGGDYTSLCEEDSPTNIIQTAKERYKVVYNSIYMPSLYPEDLISVLPGPFDFVNVDCEGTSGDIVQQMDFVSLGTRLVCVEEDKNEAELKSFFEAIEFRLRYYNGLNFFFEKV